MAKREAGTGFSADGNYYCKNGNSVSIRQTVFEKLEENPLLTAKSLCFSIRLPYPKYCSYVAKLRCEWKYYHRNEQGSKCSIHNWRGWCYVPPSVNRAQAESVGWVLSKARNRYLLWRDRIGGLQWFETGRVNLNVKKPGNMGKACQLVCNGFSFSGLITDMKVLQGVLAGLKFKGAHYVFETEYRLPKLVVDLFAESNGIIIKVGDTSHPKGIEVQSFYPDWAERNERFLEGIKNGFSFDSEKAKNAMNYVT